MHPHDVVIVGAGMAGLCAALAAAEAGATVQLLERAPIGARGGNTAFAHGSLRTVYSGPGDIEKIVPELSEELKASTEFGTYKDSDYLEDLRRLSQGRADFGLSKMLVQNSLHTIEWLRTHSVKFQPIYGRQAVKVRGKFTFSGGLAFEVSGGGSGLLSALYRGVGNQGINLRYESRAIRLLCERNVVQGVMVVHDGTQEHVYAKAVVLASGGFQANSEWRARYLGPNWDLAKVRGSCYNTGDGIRMALQMGCTPFGHWSGCHAVFCDRNAPDYGDLERVNQQKNSFHLGIVVNALGKRFVDEGSDFRNYTYARMGANVLQQPGGVAWQIFDKKVMDLLPAEYSSACPTSVQANSLEDLVGRIDGVNANELFRTLKEFNAAVQVTRPFDPSLKDGRGTVGLDIPKSNWANTLDCPPFVAFAVTAAITNSFGGVRINEDCQVMMTDGPPLRGLYAAGDLVGGINYVDHAGGSGLMAAATFGRIAGKRSAEYAAGR